MTRMNEWGKVQEGGHLGSKGPTTVKARFCLVNSLDKTLFRAHSTMDRVTELTKLGRTEV